MNSLLKKDFYYFTKSIKTVLISTLIMSSILILSGGLENSSAILSGVIVIFTNLHINNMYFDDNSDFYKQAKVMPISSFQIILSKYISGFFLIVVGSIIGSIIYILINYIFNNLSINLELFSLSIGIGFLIGFFLIILSTPIMIKFGADKARTLISVSLLLTVAIIVFLLNFSSNIIWNFKFTFIIIAALILAFLISFYISLNTFRNKDY